MNLKAGKGSLGQLLHNDDLSRSLKNTTITAAESIDKAVAMVKRGEADCFALSRDSLPPFVKQIPGSCIVEGGFQQTGVALGNLEQHQIPLIAPFSGAQSLHQKPPHILPLGLLLPVHGKVPLP
mgnify:CR=1 FL=1